MKHEACAVKGSERGSKHLKDTWLCIFLYAILYYIRLTQLQA